MRVEAVVNDQLRVPFLIDTGASGVAIPSRYAGRLGIRARGDMPYVETHTANGVVSLPLVPLQSVQLGGARVENLSATLNPSLEFGLLGGNFLNNFVYSVDTARNVITLAPNDKIRGGPRAGAVAPALPAVPPAARGARELSARARAPPGDRARAPRAAARRARGRR